MVGSFEPAVFHPSWFASHGLFGPETLAAAVDSLQLVHPQYTSFRADWLNIKVEPQRFEFLTTESVYDSDLKDMVENTFTLLAFAPVRAVGINRETHYLMDNENDAHALAYRLAPKEPWEGILEGQGLQLLVIDEPRVDPPGYLRVQVGPSGRITPGVLVSINDHYQLSTEDGPVDGGAVNSLLVSHWEESKARGRRIPDQIVGVG